MGIMPPALWGFVKVPPGRGFENRVILLQVDQEKVGCNPKGRPESWTGLKAGTEQR